MTFGKETDEPGAREQLDASLEAGGNPVDTADVYTTGTSEEMTGRCLADRPVDLREPLRLRRFMVTADRSSDPWGQFSKAMFACELEGIAPAIFSLGRAA